MQRQVGMNERRNGSREARSTPSRLIRGREKGVGTGGSGDRKVGRIKRRAQEVSLPLDDIGRERERERERESAREKGKRGSGATQVNRASLNRKVESIYGL